jgi:integrative and conjugative element protein (TIGR02256 family)
MLIFNLPGGKQRLIFTNAVITFMFQFCQMQKRQSESGGQLFAKITPKTIIVAVATGPNQRDFRHRFSFIPNKKRLAGEIKAYFAKGYHYVGDWHTHPQEFPKPSWLDKRSMRICFIKSRHELDHFILVVIGRVAAPEGIGVCLINSQHEIDLPTRPIESL